MKKIIPFFWLLVLLLACKDDENPPEEGPLTDPSEAKLITTDIDLFWQVYDAQQPNFNATQFKRDYFDSGTEALGLFFDQKIQNASRLTDRLNLSNYNSYYQSIRANTLSVESGTDQFQQAFERFDGLYPEAIFTDVVFTIGALSTGGTVVQNSQMVIGTEMFSLAADSDISDFSPWEQSVIRNASYLPTIVIHELVHVQQISFAVDNGLDFLGDNTLLEVALSEGIADFITSLIFDGVYFNDHLPAFADPVEEELWEEFQLEMNGTDLSNWLFNGASSVDRPADLGYYLGFKIAESFYEKEDDKAQAIRSIIQVIDAQEFLNQSGYAEKFN